jgi:transposase
MPKSAGTRETSPELQKIICDNASAGTPLREISHFTNLPLRTVQSIVSRGAERGHHENAARSGRQSKLDERALHHAKIVIHRDRCQSLITITNLVNEAIPSPVHPSTVRTGLNSRFEMSIHVAAKKPFINATQHKKRLDWAKEHHQCVM